jgi:hypothetical protein
MADLEIGLKTGLNELKFGLTMDEVRKMLGNPDDTETLDDPEEKTEIWYYWEDGITVFFEMHGIMRCVCLETDNPDSVLLGKKISELKENDIVDLFKKNKYIEYEIEDEEWGERRISFDDAVVDIYFDKGEIVSVNWGVDYDEEEEPIWP